MDYFIEDTYSEDSNEAQDEGCEDVEAALYSLVHHSTETYDSDMINLTENYVSQKNKANRWETFKEIDHSMNPEDSIIHPVNSQISQTLDHIPIGYNSTAGSSSAAYDKEHSRKGQNWKRGWKCRRNEKPWNIQDRIRNDYCMNRNLVPVNVERNQISPQTCAYSKNFVEINNVQTFESYRSNLPNNLNANSKFIGEGRDNIQFNENMFSPKSGKYQCLASTNENRINNIDRNNLHSENFANYNGASINTEQNKSNSSKMECIAGNISKASDEFSRKNTKLSVSASCNINKSSKNISEEIVIVSDSDEIDSDQSIVEVSIPPKPDPPVIALDSSDEVESFVASKAEPVLNVSLDCGKAVDLTVENSNLGQTSQGNKCTNDLLPTVSANSKEKKRKKRKKKKNKHVKIAECNTWTSGMIRFYNKSWGGETYDHLEIQREMTNNPIKWRILEVDKYGPMPRYGPLAKIRCANCHQFGHMAKQCPDPRKIRCCAMCGEQGHSENQCPSKMCLKCGRPAPVFNEGCPMCWKKDHPKSCTSCGANDHFQWLCPDVWRKFHSTTTADELQMGNWQEPQYKSSGELACCSCAGKGHTAAECPHFSRFKPNVTNTQPMDLFATMKLLNKKKKNKRRSYFEERYDQHEFNRKRRKTS